jgi:tellurite resistance protein TerC
MLWFWVAFNLFVLAILALDLGVFHRKAHTVRFREAAIWVAVWVSLALVFNVIVYFWKGRGPALEFLAGYLIEQSLSVDNVFIFVLIFSHFRVPAQYQHRVLFWGILGALVMRLSLILLGAALLKRFEWVIYLFGVFLVYTGFRMLMHRDEEIEIEDNPQMRFFRRVLPNLTEGYEGRHFFVRRDGKLFATPLALVLVMVESSDLIFAVDSIPAIFGVTRDPFIVYTSNVFAIMGLRSLYFMVAGVLGLFRYLTIGLALVLMFIGVKMLLVAWEIHIPIGIALGVVIAILATAILASIRAARGDAAPGGDDPEAVDGSNGMDGPGGLDDSGSGSDSDGAADTEGADDELQSCP